jgi:hypothetical protein
MKRHLLGDPVLSVRPAPAVLRQGSGAHASVVDRTEEIAKPRAGLQQAGGNGEELHNRGAGKEDRVVPAANEKREAKRIAARLQSDPHPHDVRADWRHIVHCTALVPATAWFESRPI